MVETITVKQLADKAGIEGRTLRRILRAQFPRETKGKTWEWQPDDPQIESILKAVADRKPKAETPAKKTPTKKPAAKPTKAKSERTPAKKTQPKNAGPKATEEPQAAVTAEERK